MSEAMAVLEISELLILLLIASGVAILTKHVKFPYTSALVLVGLLVGAADLVPDIVLSEELVFFVFLPPLLFEGALRMDLEHLKENLKPILIYAVPGVLISTLVVGILINKALGVDFALALLFGAMISPTDPVSVLAAFKRLGVPLQLSTIIEGESVFNDGTGIVIFGIVLGMVRTGTISLTQGVLEFLFVVLGGGLIGLALGYGAFKILEKIDDHLIEVTVTLILAFSAFLISEELHTSGVIAVVMAGLIMGNYGRTLAMSPSTRIVLTTFWDLAVFIVNSFVFILIGKEINPGVILSTLPMIAVAIGVVLLGRALSVYPLSALYNSLSRDRRIPLNWQHTSFWGGLHGSIPVALVLGLESTFPGRDLLLSLTFGVVFWSLVVQGLTFEMIVPRFGLSKKAEEAHTYEKALGRSIALGAALDELDRLAGDRLISRHAVKEVKMDLEVEKKAAATELKEILGRHENLMEKERVVARTRALMAMKSSISRAVQKEIIGNEAALELIREVDAELDGLKNE